MRCWHCRRVMVLEDSKPIVPITPDLVITRWAVCASCKLEYEIKVRAKRFTMPEGPTLPKEG